MDTIREGSYIKVVSKNQLRDIHAIGKVTMIDSEVVIIDPVVVKVFVNGTPVIGYCPWNRPLEFNIGQHDIRLINPEEFEDFLDSKDNSVLSTETLEKILDDLAGTTPLELDMND